MVNSRVSPRRGARGVIRTRAATPSDSKVHAGGFTGKGTEGAHAVGAVVFVVASWDAIVVRTVVGTTDGPVVGDAPVAVLGGAGVVVTRVVVGADETATAAGAAAAVVVDWSESEAARSTLAAVSSR
jgi:hypothetical protein